MEESKKLKVKIAELENVVGEKTEEIKEVRKRTIFLKISCERVCKSET